MIFDDVTFFYPIDEDSLDDKEKSEINPIFEHFSASLPSGFVSLVGQNGCGKSTLMLLASGRLLPASGTVSLLGKNPALLSEENKNLLASVVYQNMEFESEEAVSSLLSHVFENGAHNGKASGIRSSKSLLDEVIEVFALSPVLSHSLTALSKGEIQRVLLAFSILYGSKSIFMDEPLFALEESQKESSLLYLRDFVHKTKTTIYISMHEIDLSKKYADTVLLFYPNRDMALGSPVEVLTDEELEKAYQIPAALLKKKEDLTREHLLGESDLFAKSKVR